MINYDALFSDAMRQDDWSETTEEVYGRDLRYDKKAALALLAGGGKSGFIPTNFDKLNKLVKALHPRIFYNRGDDGDALYDPNRGHINFPEPSLYITPVDYARTVLHELSHWTQDNGVKRSFSGATILDDFMNVRTPYALEELTAELSVVLASRELLDLPNEDGYSLHYLRSWMSATKHTNDEREPRELFDIALENAKRVVSFYAEHLEA